VRTCRNCAAPFGGSGPVCGACLPTPTNAPPRIHFLTAHYSGAYRADLANVLERAAGIKPTSGGYCDGTGSLTWRLDDHRQAAAVTGFLEAAIRQLPPHTVILTTEER
jgi:hypothetical protein